MPYEEQLSLFDAGVQPWGGLAPGEIPDELKRERIELLAAISELRLAHIEQRVAYLLQRYPETRDSDVALVIRYWKRFQADVIEQHRPLDLDVLHELDNLESITRCRRRIQNDFRMFVGNPRTQQLRSKLQMEFYQYLAEKRERDPEIRFYLDETGAERQQLYTGVAGLCVLNWSFYEMHYAAMRLWRTNQGWPETVHFAELDKSSIPRAIALLAELQKRRAGLLFVGYAISSRGVTHRTILDLYVQLIVDSLHYLNDRSCLGSQMGLTLIKEAADGFDAVHLQNLYDELSRCLAQQFPNRIYVRIVSPVPKGREVLLECADLIAGGMQRRALRGGRNPKDKLAEAVMNVTGFDDPDDDGTKYRVYLP